MSLKAKQALVNELRKRLKDEYKTLVAAQRATQAGATHEESKPENDKDTRALEQSYLARGQAVRVLTLKDDLNVLEQMRLRSFSEESTIALGALVHVEDEDEVVHHYFLMPAGAGEVLQEGKDIIKVVTPHSPLGRALSGARIDDELIIQSPTGARSLCVVSFS